MSTQDTLVEWSVKMVKTRISSNKFDVFAILSRQRLITIHPKICV